MSKLSIKAEEGAIAILGDTNASWEAQADRNHRAAVIALERMKQLEADTEVVEIVKIPGGYRVKRKRI